MPLAGVVLGSLAALSALSCLLWMGRQDPAPPDLAGLPGARAESGETDALISPTPWASATRGLKRELAPRTAGASTRGGAVATIRIEPVPDRPQGLTLLESRAGYWTPVPTTQWDVVVAEDGDDDFVELTVARKRGDEQLAVVALDSSAGLCRWVHDSGGALATVSLAASRCRLLEVKSSTGGPAAGIPLAIYQDTDGGQPRQVSRARTDAQGRAVALVSAGEHSVRVDFDFPTRGTWGKRFDAGEMSWPLQLWQPDVGRVTVQTRAATSTALLRVVDSLDQRPVSELGRRAHPALGGGHWPLVEVGLRLGILTTAGRVTDHGEWQGPLAPGEHRVVSVDEHAAGTVTLRGTLIDASGDPVVAEALELRLHTVAGRMVGARTRPGDARFDVVVSGVEGPASRLELLVTADDGTPFRGRVELPSTALPPEHEMGDVFLTRQEPLVTGRVVGPDGEPVAHATLVLEGMGGTTVSHAGAAKTRAGISSSRSAGAWSPIHCRQSRTRADGTFQLTADTDHRALRLRVQAPGWRQLEPLAIAAGARDVHAVLEQAGTLTLLVDNWNASWSDRYQVVVLDGQRQVTRPLWGSRVRIDGLRAGACDVEVRHASSGAVHVRLRADARVGSGEPVALHL